MNWSQAYARQAASDLDTREVIAGDPSLPDCHSLHYLQMACEKLCKASMIAGGVDPMVLQGSHAYIAKQLPAIARAYLIREARRVQRDSWMLDAIRSLARDIELLNPAVRAGDRAPQNSEYPWPLPDGSIVPPADHRFDFSTLFEPAGRTLLKIVRQVAIELQRP